MLCNNDFFQKELFWRFLLPEHFYIVLCGKASVSLEQDNYMNYVLWNLQIVVVLSQTKSYGLAQAYILVR